jgi:dTDP-4-dehydrorhamnose 3,5-epimerase
MKFENINIEGVKLIKNNLFFDNRGSFIKTFNSNLFENNNFEIKEQYFSFSKKNVIRGMHFQNPPSHYTKLVSVISGEIIDVILDIRKDSQTYGNVYSTKLTKKNGISIYLPKGIAHGFLTLKSNTIVSYLQSSCYNIQNDCGIKYDTINFDWGISNPIISDRDLNFESFKDFNSLF